MAETITSILESKHRAIWTVSPDETVYTALETMAEKEIGALLVMEAGQLAGIFSERDYARKVILHGRSSRETLIREIMTPDPIRVDSEATIEECMENMTRHRIRHLPVMDKGVLVGIISIGDLVNAIIANQAHTISQLHTYIGASYPA